MAGRGYQKGANAERKAIKLLKSEGYTCVRSGGSKGPFDIIAMNVRESRAIQVKSGKTPMFLPERQRILAHVVPPGMTKEYWHFLDHAREPVIEVIGQHYDQVPIIAAIEARLARKPLREPEPWQDM